VINDATAINIGKKRRKTGQTYDMQSDEQRINILYDLLHLEKNAADLSKSYDVNYNTVRNI